MEAGISAVEFWELTPWEFSGIVEAYRRKVRGEMSAEWERVRWHAFITIQPHLAKGSGIKKPEDLLVLPWEEQISKKTLTGPELGEFLKTYGKKSRG